MLLGAKDEELSRPLLDSSGAKRWCHKGTCLGVALAMVIACTVGVALAQQPLLNSSIKKKLVMLVAMQDKSSMVHGTDYGYGNSSDFPKSRPWVYENFQECMFEFWFWAPFMSTFSSSVYKNEQRLCYCAYINSTSAADAQHRSKIVSWCVEDYQGNSHGAEICFADVCPSAVQKCTDPPCF